MPNIRTSCIKKYVALLLFVTHNIVTGEITEPVDPFKHTPEYIKSHLLSLVLKMVIILLVTVDTNLCF